MSALIYSRRQKVPFKKWASRPCAPLGIQNSKVAAIYNNSSPFAPLSALNLCIPSAFRENVCVGSRVRPLGSPEIRSKPSPRPWSMHARQTK